MVKTQKSGIDLLSRIIYCMLLSLFVVPAFAADDIVTWNYQEAKTLSDDNVKLYCSAGHSWEANIPDNITAPDGSTVLELKITSTTGDPETWYKQIAYLYPKSINFGQQYRLTFYYKGSVEGDIVYQVAEIHKPHTPVADTIRKLKITPEWQKATQIFTVDKYYASPVAMPRIQAGHYPDGAVLYFSAVTLERLDKTFTSLLAPEWRYVVESEQKYPLDKIPADAKPARLDNNNTFNLAQAENRVGDKATAIFYQAFTAPDAGVMTIGMAADWWFDCYVNGKVVYNTLDRGNLTHNFTPEDNVFNIPVFKGHNLLAVRVISGAAGWRFVCGKVAAVAGDPEIAKLFKPEAGDKYRPVADQHFLEIKPGTALDFTALSPRQPAGIYGRVIVSPEGKPVFEKLPEQPQRFFSFNLLLASMWRARYHEWDKPTIERFADAIMRRGYNQVRIHIPETFLVGYDSLTVLRKVLLTEDLIPQTVEELEESLDLDNLDRLDYLISALKQRGIYTNLDLAGRRMITRAGKVEHEDSFKAHLFYHPVYRQHWKLFTEYLLTRVNPYTELAYKDDPAIMQICFINEQDLRFAAGLKFLTPMFRDWLRNKYQTDAALSTAWGIDTTFDTVPDIIEGNLRQADIRAIDTGTFLIETLTEMTTWYYQIIRNTGYPGLVNHWDMIMRTLELPARALLPTIAQHTYFAHPNNLPTRNLIPKSVRPNSFVGNHDSDCIVSQASSLNSSYFRAAAVARFLDRPYYITEYSHCCPNRYRHERGLYFSSYAALQDWDTLTSHSDAVLLHLDPFLRFDSALDPISRANEALTALIYLRGDVQVAPHTVALEVSNATMFPKHYLSAIGDDYAKMSFVTRLGLLYPEITPLEPVGKASPDLVLTPTDYTYLPVSQWYVSPATSGSGNDQAIFQKLRQNNILSADNPTDPDHGIYVSETGELTLRTQTETMTVITPRLEGAIVKQDQSVILDNLTINRCNRPAAITLAAIDADKPLTTAKRLLLVVQTNAFNTGQIFNTIDQTICYESGDHPALIEAAKIDLTLKQTRENPRPKIYALHFDGTRAEEIVPVLENDNLQLKLDTGKLQYGAIFFEIVY